MVLYFFVVEHAYLANMTFTIITLYNTFFIIPLLMHMSQAIVIMLCPSSICRGYFFHILDFYSETAERNSMKLTYRKQNLNVLYKVCVFSGRSEKQDGLHGLAETFSTYLLKPLNGIQQNLTGSKILMSSTKYCVFRVHPKDKMAVTVCPGL